MLPLILLGIGTGIAWSAWFFVVLKFDPNLGGIYAHAMFYASTGLALLGSLLLIGLIFHKWRHGIVASRHKVSVIAREALLIVVFVEILFKLGSARLLKWWNILPLAILMIVVELFFMSMDKKNNPRPSV